MVAKDLYPFAAAGAMLVLSLVLVLAEPLRSDSREQTHFDVRASESGGSIQLQWDPSLPAVRNADSGVLSVEDGTTRQTYEVEERVLRAGTLIYRRHTGDVLVHLRLRRSGRNTGETTVRIIGPGQLVNPAAPAAGSRRPVVP